MGRSFKGIGTTAKTRQKEAAIGKVTDTRPRWHSTEKPKKKPRVLLDISKPFDDEFRFVLSDAQKCAGYAAFFVEVIKAPLRGEWLGHNGTLKYMMGEFNVPAGSRGVLVRVLDDVVQYAKGFGLGRVTVQPPQMARCSAEASARRRPQQKTRGSTLTWRRRDCG